MVTEPLQVERLALGKLYFKIVDFSAAVRTLQNGLQEARRSEDWTSWCTYVPLLLRIWAERLDFESISSLKHEISDLQRKGLLHLNSTTYYALGIAAAYALDTEQARNNFEKALQTAQTPLESGHARFGLATVLFQNHKYEQAVESLRLLQDSIRETLLTDLKLATGLLTAFCHRYMGNYEAALDLLGPLQETCRGEQNLYMSLNLLFCYGTIYQAQGHLERAREHYLMVQTLLAPGDLRHLDKQVSAKLKEIDGHKAIPIRVLRLVQNGRYALVTPERGEIPLGNRFVLLSLLKFLGQAPGMVVSKEQIAQRLWKQPYNPLVHDNKIYVTIRRLRELLEADVNEPSYILSQPDGYMFNPNAKMVIEA